MPLNKNFIYTKISKKELGNINPINTKINILLSHIKKTNVENLDTAPNCRKQKINVLFYSNNEYYSKENTSSFSNISQNENLIPKKEKNSTGKVENCLYQLNMLTADQELLIEMIYQIEDKEAKAKYIRKIMEQNTKTKNSLPLSNAYRFKDIVQQIEIQNLMKIQDLQIEIKQIKTQTEELKTLILSI